MTNKSRGSLTAETLILIPALTMFVLLIVYASRLTEASFRVHRAADVSARIASQSNTYSMISRGIAAGHSDLIGGKPVCERTEVSVKRGHIGRVKTVTTAISCVVSSTGIGLLSLPERTVRASSTEVVDYFSGR